MEKASFGASAFHARPEQPQLTWAGAGCTPGAGQPLGCGDSRASTGITEGPAAAGSEGGSAAGARSETQLLSLTPSLLPDGLGSFRSFSRNVLYPPSAHGVPWPVTPEGTHSTSALTQGQLSTTAALEQGETPRNPGAECIPPHPSSLDPSLLD